MKKERSSIAACVGVLLLLSVTCAFAQDSPQWRGANRDGKVTGFTAPQTWPTELTQKWKVTVGLGDATPALVGKKLYVFARKEGDEVALCLSAADGKELWSDKYAAAAPTGGASRHPGPRSSPTVASGKVVTLGVTGILSCFNAATGKLVWRKDEFPGVVPQFATSMSPIIVDRKCIAHLGGKDNGAVIAYDLATGKPLWKWAGEGPSYSSPVLMTAGGVKQIVLHTEKSLVGLAVTDGKLLWQVPTPTQGRYYNSATPILDGQTVIYTGQGQGTKAVRVEKQGDGLTAKELWSNAELGTGYNTPVLKDGLLFGLSDKGNFFCINSQTGQTAWTDTAKRPNFCSLLNAGSALLALPNDSVLIAFKPSDKEYTELAHIKVSDKSTYAHPVVAGKRIFVKDQETLTMWTIEGG
ncbi:MAG: PQQ-binding-like beta-propeller repeat protein [Armatimonadetes bacterium]|nr:PQQ-binding-like beta-propeller repeat protein [Armatimonadota bacterium]